MSLVLPHRSCGLHGGGGESLESAGWSRVGAVCCWWRAVPDLDSQQANPEIQCALPRLHQQVGPHGSKPLPCSEPDEVGLYGSV